MSYARFGWLLALVLSAMAGAPHAQSFRLSGEMARGNLLRGTAELARDGRRVVFTGTYSRSGRITLYSVPSDGRAEPMVLFDPEEYDASFYDDLEARRELDASHVAFFRITPDSRRVVFVLEERGQLISVASDAPAPQLVLAPIRSDATFQLGPDGARAVYLRQNFSGLPSRLYSVPTDGSAGEVELVEPPTLGPGHVVDFAIEARASRVVFTFGDESGSLRLYSVPIDGSAPPTRLSHLPLRAHLDTSLDVHPRGAPVRPTDRPSVADFVLAPDGRHVAFLVQEPQSSLYVVPTDGHAPARLLASGDVHFPAFTPDSARIAYRATPLGSGTAALFVRPIDGSGAARRLFEPAEALVRLEVLAKHVLFVEEPSGSGGARLFQVPLDGSRPAQALSLALPAGRTIRDFRTSPDGRQVVFSADADQAGVFTLFASPVEPGAHLRPNLVRLGGSADVARFTIAPDSSAVLAHVVGSEGLDLEHLTLDGRSVRRLSGPEGASDLRVDDLWTVAVYRGAREHDTAIHVYVAALNGRAPARQLDDFGPVLGSLHSYALHPNGREAVFAAASRDFAFPEFHRVALDGASPPRLLPGLLVGSESLVDYLIEPHSERLVYRIQVPQSPGYHTGLYSAPLDGRAPRVELSPGPGTQVFEYDLAGERVIYRKDTGPDNERFQVFSVPVDGSSAPVVLNGALPSPGGRVFEFAVSPDGTRVVYIASQNQANRPEIFSVPSDGSLAAVQLNPPPVTGGEVWRGGIRFTADGSRVVFAGDLARNNAFGLHVAPLDGSAPALTLYEPTAGREVTAFELTPDSMRAVFTADGVVGNRHQLYVVPLDGSTGPTPLPFGSVTPNVYQFRLTPDATAVVYMTTIPGQVVAIVPLDGSASPVSLSDPPVTGGHLVAKLPAVSNEWVIYQGDLERLGQYDFYAARLDGSSPSHRVNDPIEGTSPLTDPVIVGHEVVFVAPVEPYPFVKRRLFRAPISGSGPVRPINLPGTFTSGFLVHPDGRRVLFPAAADSGSSGLYVGLLGLPPIRAGTSGVEARPLPH